MPAAAADYDVLIVGGGPVGLSLALELGLRGNHVALVEREVARGPQPRAKTLNMRSLEHFRRWGVADAVRAASPIPPGYPTDVIFRTRLFGKHIARLPNIYFRGNERAADPRFSEPSEWIPQHIVEGVLKARVETLPNVAFKSGCELVSFSADDAGVTALLRDAGGNETRVRSAYLVGADGARSRVREVIGAKMSGRHAYDANYTLMLRIPELTARPPEPRGIMHWTINADYPGVIGPIGELWYLSVKLPAGASGMSDDEIARVVEATVGHPVDFELVGTDAWYAHELIADKYREGRVFLAGDACHLHPPFGGYGMNMGVADAVDLGWKLDAVLHGWGGETLLDSYAIERRQVHQWTIDESVANYALLSQDLVRPGLEDDDEAGAAARAGLAVDVIEQKRREFHTIGLVLGYHYGGSPVIACDDRLPPPSAEHYDPKALCGTLAPHFWLAHGVSLYDRFGTGFTLLHRGDDNPGVKVFVEAAALLGVPMTVLALGSSPKATHLYGTSLTLVRPDEHIAWRGGATDHGRASAILAQVTGR